MDRPRLLDLFCGAGGCSVGYERAGFDVIGVDIEDHPDYPFDKRHNGLATVVGVHGHINYAGEAELRSAAMGIDWMTHEDLAQAIPPAYTEHVGHYLMAEVQRRRQLAA
jgi:site-specific DNA-cytosine methylase